MLTECTTESSYITIHLNIFSSHVINSYNISRFAIAFIWLYHGLIPKLIFQHATELELINKAPVLGTAKLTLLLAGISEVLAGICVIAFWNQVWPIYSSLIGFIVLLVASVAISPEQAVHAFNPITLTMSAIFFCLIQICSRKVTSEKIRGPQR